MARGAIPSAPRPPLTRLAFSRLSWGGRTTRPRSSWMARSPPTRRIARPHFRSPGAAANSPGIFPIILGGTNYAPAVFLDGKIAADPSNGPAYFRNAGPFDG